MLRPKSGSSQRAAAPGKFKPTRDRAVALKSVACPICGAAVNAPCTPAGNTHAHRRRLAIRLENSRPASETP